MNLLKNTLMCAALIPLLPAIALAWICRWATPESAESARPIRTTAKVTHLRQRARQVSSALVP